HATLAASIGATRSTFQALTALRASGGAARTVDNDALVTWQRALAREGVYTEPSAAAPLEAVRQLRAEGRITAGDSVVVVATAGGLKDPDVTARALGDVPVVVASLDAVGETLARVYGFSIG